MESNSTMVDRRARLKAELLAECAEDHVGLWSVFWQTQRTYPEATRSRLRSIALGLLKELLKQGLIQAGFPGPDGIEFHPWLLPADSIIERIGLEWTLLRRDPNIGEIAWFTTADRDGRIARAVRYEPRPKVDSRLDTRVAKKGNR